MKVSRDLVMETLCRELGQQLAAELADTSTGPAMGFALLIFDFSPGTFLTHISNAQRSDLIKLLREHADKLEAGRENELGYKPPGSA